MRTADLRAAGRGRGVSGRAVFGDFTGAARQQLGSPAALRTAAVRGGHVPEIRHSLLRLVLVMSRYVQDITRCPSARHPWEAPRLQAGTGPASKRARRSERALAGLYGDTISRRRPGVQAGSELARRLDGAALSLTYGRDLLHTHLARGPRGGVRYQSEWGKVVTSPRVHQALLAELGFLARQLAPLGEDLARSPRARGSPAARQAVTGACHWLQIMDTSIRQALREDPLPAGVLALLRAVPVNSPPPRLAADASGPASGLPGAVIDAAERARHAAWLSATQPPWPPGMTVSSLRQVAAANTFTSRHCERCSAPSLPQHRASRGRPGPPYAQPQRPPGGPASAGWASPTRSTRSPPAARSSHPNSRPQPATSRCGQAASPTPTRAGAPGSKPARRGRRGGPSREPGEAARVLAASHEACDAMNRLASADRRQVRLWPAPGDCWPRPGPGRTPWTCRARWPRAARPDRGPAHPVRIHRPGQRRSDHRRLRSRYRGRGAAPSRAP